MYNVWDLVGRYTPLIKFTSITSRKGLMLAISSRFLFIPAFYFTVKYGTQGWMIMLTSLLGITNGHLTVCVMTAAPQGYKVSELNLPMHYHYLVKTISADCVNWENGLFPLCRDLSKMPWGTCSSCSSSGA